MGKKSFYKKQIRPLLNDNRILFAALGGVAVGIAIAKILGTDKAKEILQTVEKTIGETADRATNGLKTLKTEQNQEAVRSN